MQRQSRALLVSVILAAAALAAFAQESSTGFDDLSLTVTITVNQNGTAHVREHSEMAVSFPAISTYQSSVISAPATIEAWQGITGSGNLRYHVLGTPLNTRVYPQQLTRLQYINKSIAIISIEYDTSSPIFFISEIGPRKSRYTLKPVGSVFSFTNAAGANATRPEQILPENTALKINVLPDSEVDLYATFPKPTSPQTDAQLATARYYAWNATGVGIRITEFEFSFVTEESLDDEVSAYFASLQGSLTGIVFSSYGAVAAFVAVSLALLFLALKNFKVI
ncbi:MAG: hypothetical protein PHF51_00080 [Candidatus ainarchaeum sp.]|nr:hypothetical protein [Candidatus ainarchaeum sp.]